MNYDQTCALVRDTIVAGARLNFEVSGEVHPMSFILARLNPDTGERLDRPAFLMVPLGDHMDDKDRVRGIQQELCDRFDALAHVFVSESWIVNIDPAHVAEPELDAIASLAEHPKRKEAITVSLEHEDGRVATWLVPITRDKDGAPVLGETEESDAPWDGRMSGYLKAVRDRKVQA